MSLRPLLLSLAAALVLALPLGAVDLHVAAYDRDAFGGWADTDGDCRNTRHELLADLSTVPARWSASGCTVRHGRWHDPYTDRIHTEARKLDIDHLVPLAWAWDHGAARWSDAKRARFANDPVNLFPVTAAVNRQKGAKGPLEWLPPSAGFHCGYVLRFRRVTVKYGLGLPRREARAMARLQDRLCGSAPAS